MPQTLLLADDSVTIQRVIELTFADEDIDVVAVSDGDQAIARIDTDPPDIVLVDIGMPGKSGYEVAHHIKQSARLQHIPVLLLAGAFEPVDQAKATAAGCNGVLAKPFEPQLVISRVRELLGMERRDASPVAAEQGVVKSVAPAAKAPVSDLWGAGPGPAQVEPARESNPVAQLDNYFAELDAAFATLESTPAVPSSSDASRSPVPDSLDWFDLKTDTRLDASLDLADTLGLKPDPTPDRGEHISDLVEHHSGQIEHTPGHAGPAHQSAERAAETAVLSMPDVTVGATEGAADTAESIRLVPNRTSAPGGALPSLPDAFAAILAAEQHEATPAAALAWPAPPASGNAAALLTDAAVEEITRKVLERLSDRVVRDTVADLVSKIAERLVKDEIERIKSTIT